MTLIDKQDDLFINDSRFEIGMKLFNSCQWYKSHDVFEEIWHETGGPERQLIQGILQVAVAQVHLENGNFNGATILYGEALGRLKKFKLANFGLDIEELLNCVSRRLEFLQIGKELAGCSLPVLSFL
jgi:predicted metal-dependent hydrolase